MNSQNKPVSNTVNTLSSSSAARNSGSTIVSSLGKGGTAAGGVTSQQGRPSSPTTSLRSQSAFTTGAGNKSNTSEENKVTSVTVYKSASDLSLGKEFTSRGYITRTLFFGDNLKALIEDALLQPGSDQRNEGYGVTFVTIGFPQAFLDSIYSTARSEVHRPIRLGTVTWFNASLADTFDNFFVYKDGKKAVVPLGKATIPAGSAFSCRLLVNMYVSRPVNGGHPVLRVKIHDAQFVKVVRADVPGKEHFAKPTPTRITSFPTNTQDTLFKAFEGLALDDSNDEK